MNLVINNPYQSNNRGQRWSTRLLVAGLITTGWLFAVANRAHAECGDYVMVLHQSEAVQADDFFRLKDRVFAFSGFESFWETNRNPKPPCHGPHCGENSPTSTSMASVPITTGRVQQNVVHQARTMIFSASDTHEPMRCGLSEFRPPLVFYAPPHRPPR
jgi:hypothetical protein